MDMEDGEPTEGVSISEEKNVEKVVVPHAGEIASEGNSQIPYCYVSPIPFFCTVFSIASSFIYHFYTLQDVDI